MGTVRRICCLSFALALAAAGAPLAAAPCGSAQSACAWMLAAAGCPAQPVITTAMTCCHGVPRASAAPTPAAVGAPGVHAPAPADAEVALGLPALAITGRGTLERTARRHELGLFLLAEVFRL